MPLATLATNSPRSTRTPPSPPAASTGIPLCQFYGSAYISHLEKQLTFYKSRCAMLATEIQNLKRKVNQRDNAPSHKRWKVVTNARMLTSDGGLRLAEEQEAGQEAKRQKEPAQKRLDRETERRQRAEHDPNEPFRGSLTSKSKADLQELASALGLSEDGIVKDLRTRITAHFDANSHLRDSPHFAGLFTRTRTSRSKPTNDANINLPSSFQHPSQLVPASERSSFD